MNPEKFNSHVKMAIHEITKSEKDPTLMPVKFTIIDFEPSGNKTQMSKEVALEGGKTLKDKPIVAKYFETTDYYDQDDNFGTHEEIKKRNRYGDMVDAQDTIPIGVFTSEGYLDTIEIDGVMKEVMVADGHLWYYKFQDACELLYEWHQKGININTSCEYLYFNYSKIDGITHHLAPVIFNAHAILASETRGNQEEVTPSYKSSRILSINELNKFSELVTNAFHQEAEKESKEEDELADNKDTNQEDLKNANAQNHEEAETDATDVGTDNPTNEDVNTDTDDKSTDEESKADEKSEKDEEEVDKVDNEKAEEEKDEPANEATDLEKANQKNAELQAELDDARAQLDKATNTALALNSRIKDLEAIEVQFNEHVAKGKVQAQFNEFKPKFDAVGATEKFESEEVQNLLTLSIHETEDGRKALMSLQSMIIEAINIPTQDTNAMEKANLGLHSYKRADYNKQLDENDVDDFDRRYLSK